MQKRKLFLASCEQRSYTMKNTSNASRKGVMLACERQRECARSVGVYPGHALQHPKRAFPQSCTATHLARYEPRRI